MAFPQTILPLQVDISLDGSTWTNITSSVRGEQQIRITRGRSDWGQQVDYGRCQLTLSNNDGRYSPRNPTAVYYGQIGRNTPLRVSVNTGSVALDLPGGTGDYAETTDTAVLDITGDLDVRFDATLTNWILPDYPSTGQSDYSRTELIGKYASTQRSWVLYIRRSRPFLSWSTDGSNETNTAACTADLPLTTSGRLAVRATLDVDNGASGNTTTFYYADTINGPWTQLGDPVTAAGVTSIFSGSSSLKIGDAAHVVYNPALGRVHAAQVRSGIGGTTVANPDFTAQTSGSTSFTDSAGRPWTLAGNAQITNRKTRFCGEVASWTPRWDTGGKDVVCDVEAAGVLRRLGTGSVPVKSPMYREFTSSGRVTAGIGAYWPMEDGTDTTRLASAIAGHPAATITGAVTPAAYPDWVASSAIPTLTTGSIKAAVPAYTQSGGYSSVGFFTKVPTAGVSSTQRLMSFSHSGTSATWSIYINTSGQLDIRAYDADGINLLTTGFDSHSINGLEKYVILTISPSGALNTAYLLTVVDIAASLTTAIPNNAASAYTVSGTLTGATTGQVTQVRFGEDAGMNGTALGHLAIGGTSTAFSATGGVLVGWNAEEAASRTGRIGIEEKLHSYPTGPGDEQCGPQPQDTALGIMRAAADVDEGILAEQRTVLGIRHVTRASMYNQPAVLTLNYPGSDGLVAPLDPADDDQTVTNDVTVQRTSGASGRRALDTGTLSTLAPPNGIGLYDTSYTLNLLDDDQPDQHAGWRLHLGTWDETRYPQVTVNLANAPASIEAATAVDVGSRAQITNPPSWLPPDTIDLHVQGYSETLDQYTWTLTFNCTPYGPWNVAWAGAATSASATREFAWADTSGSTLAEALTTTETDVDVLTSAGAALWTPYVKDTPFDWRIAGEVMTVTAPHTLINTNPFFGTNISDWSVENSTLTRSTSFVPPHPRATASMLITPTGGQAFVGAQAGITPVDSITPGASYTVGYWAYSVDGWSDIRPTVTWYTSGSVFISTVSATAAAIPASKWTYFEATFVAPATASRAQGRVRMGSTPAVSDTLFVWAARITRAKSSAVYDTFGRTVASGWGVADSGQTWTVVGTASEYSTNSTYGVTTHPSVGISHLTTIAAPSADVDLYVDVAASALATGASLFTGPIVRESDNNNLYQARVEFTTANQILLTLRKRVAGVETQLGSTFASRFTHVAATFYRVRMQVIGSALKAKLWLATDFEPDVWHIETTDSSLSAAANLGTRSFRNTGNTNASVELRFDNFDLINPQTYTVTRSVNRAVKAQSAGASVALAYPAYIAL